jgi:hypothetical protein
LCDRFDFNSKIHSGICITSQSLRKEEVEEIEIIDAKDNSVITCKKSHSRQIEYIKTLNSTSNIIAYGGLGRYRMEKGDLEDDLRSDSSNASKIALNEENLFKFIPL